MKEQFKEAIEIKVEFYSPHTKGEQLDAAAKACEELCEERMHQLLIWYQSRGDEYRRNTLLVDVLRDFKNRK